MNLLQFHFDGNDCDVFVSVGEITYGTKASIEDAITSYVENVEDWEYEELVEDVLRSFDIDFKIIYPIRFEI